MDCYSDSIWDRDVQRAENRRLDAVLADCQSDRICYSIFCNHCEFGLWRRPDNHKCF